MEYRLDLAPSGGSTAVEAVTRSQPRRYRHKIRSLAYVRLASGDGGILCDVSEFGLAMHAVTTFAPDQQVLLRFELPNPRVRVEAAGRVAWTDPVGRAGIEFVDLPERSRRLLQEWLLTQILAGVERTSSCDSTGPGDGATGLLFSAAARPPIRLDPRASHMRAQNLPLPRLRLLWFPVPISPSTLSGLVDGLTLSCAVLLFAVISLTWTGLLPPWPVALGVALGASATLGALYWLVFVIGIGTTPGKHLARLAFSNSRGKVGCEEESRARFR